MSGVNGYLRQVDLLLSAGCAVFPNGAGVPAIEGAAEPSHQASPPDSGGLAEALEAAAAGYRQAGARIVALSEALRQELNDAAVEAQRGRDAAIAIRGSARSQAAAIAPGTEEPDGLGLLVSTMDERLAAMQGELRASRARLQQAAARILRQSQELAEIVPE
ncbi:hypothetical protein [Mycobacterium sp.]|uniref:hypothetical protein n=1 Tax=Mycobacterium sp. TaxID=1785 RepID=UPI002CA13AF5|nr:hypothetical protein [Mycobacterium sp.]HTQ19041.1 hypothetical protein [Mycobacterium sp.]